MVDVLESIGWCYGVDSGVFVIVEDFEIGMVVDSNCWINYEGVGGVIRYIFGGNFVVKGGFGCIKGNIGYVGGNDVGEFGFVNFFECMIVGYDLNYFSLGEVYVVELWYEIVNWVFWLGNIRGVGC